MRRAHGTKALRIGAFEVPRREDRVGPFQAQDIADGCIGRRTVLPALYLLVELLAIGDRPQLAALLHGAIPRQLPLCLRPGLRLGVPPR